MSDEQPVNKPLWYWSKGFVLFVLMSAGPFGLPLVWFNPHFSSRQKWIWSAVTVTLTLALGYMTVNVLNNAMRQAKELGLIQ